MSWFKPTSLLDKIFEGGLILKGLSGALEFLGGFCILFINPYNIHNFITFLTQRELTEDPNDKLANFIIHSTAHINIANKTFLIAYLWIHALIKLIAVIGILRNQMWAYPFSLITLGILMLYQVYSITQKASLGMIVLSLFDVFILWLIWREYGKAKTKLATNN